MLFRNSHLAFMPPLPHFPHQWEECLKNKIPGRCQDGEAIQFRVGTNVVEIGEKIGKLPDMESHVGSRRFGIGTRTEQILQVRSAERGDLTNRVTLFNEAAEQDQLRDVVFGVKTTAIGSLRGNCLVASLPGPERVNAKRGEPRGRPDWVMWVHFPPR